MLSTYDHKCSLLKAEYLSKALSELLYHSQQKKSFILRKLAALTAVHAFSYKVCFDVNILQLYLKVA